MRLGWEVPNPVNILEQNPLVRFPLSMVVPTTPMTTYDVTFTVTDGTDAIEGAKVTMGGQRKTTNSSGVAVLKSQANSTYQYQVKSEGKSTVKGSVGVTTSNASVTVTMN